MTGEQPNEHQTFSVAQVAAALDVKPDMIAKWAARCGAEDLDALDLDLCAAIGAVVTMATQTPAKQLVLRVLFLELMNHDRQLDEWLLIKHYRRQPAVVDTPLTIDAVKPADAQPVIYDPLKFLARLNVGSGS